MLAKGSNKFDCLIKEMLFIRKLKPSLNVLVCYTAVFSVVTQRGGALRDDTKNACVADYKRAGGLDSRKGIHLKNLWSFVIMLICRDYRNQIFALFIHLD